MTVARLLLVVSTLLPAPSAAPAQDKAPKPAAAAPRLDRYGDPLPVGALARFGPSRFRVAEPATIVSLSNDAKTIALSQPGGVWLLDAVSGRPLKQLPTPAGATVTSLTFTPDGRVLAGAFYYHNIQLWDVASGKPLTQIHLDDKNVRLGYLSFSADGKILAAGDEGSGPKRQAFAWDATTGKKLGAFPVMQRVRIQTALSPDGKTLATWGQHGTIPGAAADPDPERTFQLWDVQSGKELHRLKTEYTLPLGAAFSPDGKRLATFSGAATIRIWNVERGTELRRFSGRRIQARAISHMISPVLRFLPDCKRLAMGTQDGTIQIWDSESGRRLALHDGPRGRFVGLAIPGPDRVLGYFLDWHALQIWDATADKMLTPTEGHVLPVHGLTFSADGQCLLSGGVDGHICWWDLASGKEIKQLRARDVEELTRPSPRSGSFALAPGGKYLARGNDFAMAARLWDLERGRVVCDFEGFAPYQPPIAFSPDGSKLAVEGRLPDKTAVVYLWETVTGRMLQRLETGIEGAGVSASGVDARRIAFSEDGKLLAVALNSNRAKDGRFADLLLWRVADGKQVCRVSRAGRQIQALAFAPDGESLAALDAGANTGGQDVILWRCSTGKELRRVENVTSNIYCLAFAPDGQTLVGAGHDASVRNESRIYVWELATGQVRHAFPGHGGYVGCLVFTPGGAALASGGADTTTLLWDVSGRFLAANEAADARELEALWKELASPKAPLAFRAMGRLAAAPATSVPLLRARLKPATKGVDDKIIRKLVADLEAAQFATRDEAMRALEGLGVRALPLLEERLQQKPPLETERRILGLLERAGKVMPLPDGLRILRAIEVLERIGTAAARAVLTVMSRGAAGAGPTERARQAMERLPQR